LLYAWFCYCMCLWYRGGAGNTVGENSSVFSLVRMRYLPSVLRRCWLGGRKSIRPVKKYGGMVEVGTVLVRIEWRPARGSVCLPLLIFPCTIKSRSSLLVPAHPGGPGKRAVKWLWCGGMYVCMYVCMYVSFGQGSSLLWNHTLRPL